MQPQKGHNGFTLIELLVVMAIIGTLLTLAAPRYAGSVEKAKEATLKGSLWTLRDLLDKHYADTGQYPAALNELVSKKYIRRIPIDPFTGNNTTWVVIPPTDQALGGVYDVRSGAQGTARDGTLYQAW